MTITFERATVVDADAVLAMMREFYAIDNYAFDEGIMRSALVGLIADATLGGVWLIHAESQLAGYLVLTFGYSLEFHGRDALLDELFLLPPYRGQGIGTKAVRFVEEQCSALGIHALHLEVERGNTVAQQLYRHGGFRDSNRFLMTKWLTSGRQH